MSKLNQTNLPATDRAKPLHIQPDYVWVPASVTLTDDEIREMVDNPNAQVARTPLSEWEALADKDAKLMQLLAEREVIEQQRDTACVQRRALLYLCQQQQAEIAQLETQLAEARGELRA